jgi:hypothetical protein
LCETKGCSFGNLTFSLSNFVSWTKFTNVIFLVELVECSFRCLRKLLNAVNLDLQPGL